MAGKEACAKILRISKSSSFKMRSILLVEGIVHTTDIIANPFGDDNLVLVCGRKHKLYGIKSISLDELSGLRFIVREKGSGTRELFENMMA